MSNSQTQIKFLLTQLAKWHTLFLYLNLDFECRPTVVANKINAREKRHGSKILKIIQVDQPTYYLCTSL